MHEMKLFVTGSSPTSMKAIENLTRLANDTLRHGYRLEVIDILRQPHEACAEGVFCTPMLVKKSPSPEAWVLGELTDEERLMRVLVPGEAPPQNTVPPGGKPARVRSVAAPANHHASAHPQPKKIVVIDDYEGVHDSFRAALDETYVDLICTRTGELGVAATRTCNPNLIYLDLNMPVKDGVATLHDLRKEFDTPIIIMTAFAEEFMDQLRSADREGLEFEILAKPLDIDQIHLVSAVATGGFGPSLA